MKRRVIFLLTVVVLFLPFSIILFLHVFGSNTFKVPLFYENSVQQTLDNALANDLDEYPLYLAMAGLRADTARQVLKQCGLPNAPHTVSGYAFTDQQGQVLTNANLQGKLALWAAIPQQGNSPGKQAILNAFEQVHTELGQEQKLSMLLHVVGQNDSLSSKDIMAGVPVANGAYPQWRVLPVAPVVYQQFANCGLLLPAVTAKASPELNKSPYLVVLTDTQGRIRGYFDAGDQQEIDRILLELDILLGEL